MKYVFGRIDFRSEHFLYDFPKYDPACVSRLRASIFNFSQRADQPAEYKSRAEELLNEAQNRFSALEFPVSEIALFIPAKPAHFQMRSSFLYWKLGFQKEAIENYEEYVALSNRLSRRFYVKDSDGNFYSYFSASTLPKEFLDTKFQQIKTSIGKVEHNSIRYQLRLSLLKQILAPDLISGNGGGMLRLNRKIPFQLAN